MYCAKCGHQHQDDAIYCVLCGVRVEAPQNNSGQQEPKGEAFAGLPTQEVAAAESKAVTALIMGIVSIVTSFLILGTIAGPMAIANGNGARRLLDDRNHHASIASAGIITGTVGFVISIFGTIWWIFILGAMMRR